MLDYERLEKQLIKLQSILMNLYKLSYNNPLNHRKIIDNQFFKWYNLCNKIMR